VRFGQVRAAHVEFVARSPVNRELLTAELYYRIGAYGAWTPLALTGAGGRFTAPLVPVDGQVSLRLRVGTAKWGTLEMDVEPAFIGHRSPASAAPLLQASADGAGARLDWRVPPTEGSLVVERTQPGGDWVEWGDVTPANGVAHFEDAAVAPGKRYGYRLAGAEAVAWVQIPVGIPRLALAIAPNPARGDVTLALGVDRTAPIELSLLDLQGRVMSSRRLDSPAPGALVVNFSTLGRVPPGLYFVRLVRERDVITRRVTLLE
jgi:hypothetical protein